MSDDIKKLEEQESIYLSDYKELKDEGFSKAQLIFDLLTQLKSGGDLYRISIPSAFLAPVSLLEYIANQIAPTEHILGIANKMDPEQRFLSVLKWWLGNLCNTPKKGILHTKPYNAILGEIFRCKFIHENSKTHYIAEQVSHHPPISSAYMVNREENWSLNLTVKPASKFHANSASTLLDGSIVFSLHNLDEHYEVEYPHVLARGLIFGKQCVEISEHLRIKCEKTGFNCDIEFSSGNSCKGTIKKGNETVYSISGSLSATVDIKSEKGGKTVTLVDSAKIPKFYKYVTPVAQQQSNESRRVWHKVSYNINNSEYSAANTEKQSVEQEQREIRKKREERSETWVPKYFKQNGSDPKSWTCTFYDNSSFQKGEKTMEERVPELFAATDSETAFTKKLPF